MSLPLEDLYEDIIGKAQRGLNLSDTDLITQSGIDADALQSALAGTFEEPTACRLAAALKLNSHALIASGRKAWHPSVHSLPEHFWQLTSDYQGVMTVNAYIAGHPDSRQAVIFDSGADAQPILNVIKEHKLQAAAILVTHGHGDHIAEIPKLKQELSAPVYAVENGADGDHTFAWGNTISLAGFDIECRRSSGHAADGTTFVFAMEDRPVAITGDALFAGSMGGANDCWQEALTCTRRNILSLPDDTLLCPGHGPVTTVALEKSNNPFFA